MFRRSRALMAIVAVVSSASASSAFAGLVSFSIPSVAVQKVALFTGTPFQIDATLTANGTVEWNLDVDGNGNTINNDSTINAQFQGLLPSEFAVLGLSGVPFELFSRPTGQSVTATNNGTVVTVNTTFGLSVPLAGASFFTSVPSTFVTSVSGIPFTEYFATSPAPAVIFIDANPLGIDPGTPVGISFDRTVASTPEPGTMTLAAIGLIGFAGMAWRKRRQAA